MMLVAYREEDEKSDWGCMVSFIISRMARKSPMA
jgi:hypothetical protein